MGTKTKKVIVVIIKGCISELVVIATASINLVVVEYVIKDAMLDYSVMSHIIKSTY